MRKELEIGDHISTEPLVCKVNTR